MDTSRLFNDFRKHVNNMSDDDIKKSIAKAVKHTTLDKFIAFAKDEYGLTVECIESDTQDSFEYIFGAASKIKEQK